MELCLEHQLKNGLKVLLIPSKQAPVVAVQAWIQYGAADEIDREAGLAHFFEHLLFKGTGKRKVGEIAREVEAVGGDINAFTSYDHTVMHMTLGSQHASTALDILSDSLMNTILDPTEIDKEREVVLEEIKRRSDNPASLAGDLLRERLFKNHPYSRPVIGYDHVLKSITREELLAAYKSRYVAENIFVVLAGDFEEDRALKEVDKYFGNLSSKAAAKQARGTAYGKSGQYLMSPHQTENIITHVAWKGASIQDMEDVVGLDLLSFVMGQSESSRLVRKLVLDEKLVDTIGMGSWTPKEAGSIDISFRAAPKSAANFPKIFRSIHEAFRERITEEELARAKKNILSSLVYSKESVDGLAQRFASMQSLGKSWRDDLEYFEKIKGARMEDLDAAADKFLKWDEAHVVGIYPEKMKAPSIPAKPFESKAAAPKAKAKAERPDVESWSFNGLKIVHKQIEHLPIVSMRWVGLGGQRLETTSNAGIGTLWSKVIDTGTQNFRGRKLSRHEVNLMLDGTSSSLSTFHGRNSWGWQLDCLKEDFDGLFELCQSLKKSPLVSPEDFALEKKYQKQQIASMKDSSSARVYQLFHEKLFGKHAYSLPTKGTVQTLEKLTREKVLSFHRTLEAQPQVLSIVGNISRSQLERVLEATLGKEKFSVNKKLLKAKKIQSPKKPLAAFEEADKEQSHILLGFPTDGMFDRDHLALVGMSSLLSGQGGRLFLELRDKLSLCYSVGPSVLDGIDGGYFAFYIGTSPEKRELALEAMWKEIEKLTKEKAPLEEWERSRTFYSGHHTIEQQYFSAQAMGMALDEVYGRGYANYNRFIEKLAKVTPDEIQRVARKYFKRAYVLAEVGPES
jgi:zinc protease